MKESTKWIIIVTIIIILIAVTSAILFNRNISYIITVFSSMIRYALSHNIIGAYFFMMLITMPQNVLFVPGLSLIYIITGYILRNFVYAFFLLLITNVSWCVLVYYIYSLFADFIHKNIKTISNIFNRSISFISS